MSNNYYRWAVSDDIPLFLKLISPTLLGATGKFPEIAVRRYRESQGGALLDGYYWDGAGDFVSTPQWHIMDEYDATNSPGLYTYLFEQTQVQNKHIYLVYYQHTVTPVGFNIEEHIVTNELYVPITAPVVPIDSGETVMGRLADMENATSPVALANADAAWDETLMQHLDSGSTGEALSNLAVGFTGASQIDITVEDTGSVPIQGAQVDIYNAANTVFLTRLHTDANGEVSLAINDDVYNVRLFASGYSFTVPEPLVVSGDAPVTFVGTSLISITPPSAPDLCVIHGTVRDAGGHVVAGACVEAYAVTPQVVSGVQKAERVAVTTTNTQGYFELELVQGALVQFKIEGTDLDIERTVPTAATQDLTTWT